jgi:D-alanyl-D-alanine carboxypeptidase
MPGEAGHLAGSQRKQGRRREAAVHGQESGVARGGTARRIVPSPVGGPGITRTGDDEGDGLADTGGETRGRWSAFRKRGGRMMDRHSLSRVEVLVTMLSVVLVPSAGCGDDSSTADDGGNDDTAAEVDVDADADADADADGDTPGDIPDDGDAGPDYSVLCQELFAAAQAQLEAEFTTSASRLILPGIVLGLDVPRCGEWRGAVGDSVFGTTPMTTDRVMNIASITKTFVAAVVLQLVAEGALGLEDTLDNWRTDIPNAATITVRQLLSHRAGVRSHNTDVDCAPRLTMSNTPEDLLACIAGDPADFLPGTAFGYSNTGYVLLGLVIEAVTGSDLHSVIRSRLIEPLGLSHTSFGDEAQPEEYATAYDGHTDATGAFDLSFLWACGDMRSDARDLLTFIRAVVSDDVLDDVSRAEMQTFLPTAESPVPGPGIPASWGLGISRVDLGEIWDVPFPSAIGNMGCGESTSVAWYLPDLGVAATMLVNHVFSRSHEAFVWQSTSRILIALGDRLRALYP